MFAHFPDVEVQRMFDSRINGVTEHIAKGEEPVYEKNGHENVVNERFSAVRDNTNDGEMDTSEENGNANIAVIDRWNPSGVCSANKKARRNLLYLKKLM